MKRCVTLIVTCVAVLIFGGFGTEAMASITVEPIAESKLDALLNAEDGPLVVTFMAAWCGPCVDELPVLDKLYRQYHSKGFKLIGISIDLEGPQAMQPIIDKLRIAFPVYWYGEKAVKKFKLNAIPMLFFIKDGKIVEKLYGRHPERSLNKRFEDFLK